MQPGSARFPVSARAFAVIAAILIPGLPAQADEFEAFTWARHHPASTDHVSPLIQIDPWTNLQEASAQLKQLPSGKRFIVFHSITDGMADHPLDRVISRTWETRTRQVPAPAAPAAAATTAARPAVAARGSAVNASKGRAPASAAARVAPAPAPAPAASRMVTVTERVPVDRLTAFRGPWMDNGIQAVRARVLALMQQLKSMGTPVDGIVLSNETTLHAACFMECAGSLAAIERDPRWPALASSMGLPAVVSDMWWGTEKYFLWTERMAGRFDAAMNQAVFAPIRAVYPNAVVSNYCSGRQAREFASPDVNGHLDRRQTAGFGSHDNFEFYGWSAQRRIDIARGAEPADDAWAVFRVEMHKIRGMNASSSRPKHAWIAQRSWEGEWYWPVRFESTPIWDELVLQLGMHGVRQFLELSIEDFSVSREANLARRAEDREVLDDLLGELNERVSGSSEGVFTASQPSWNDQVIATGRRVGDRVVWRFSFAPGTDAVRVELQDGTEAVITAEEGRRGAWFEHGAATGLVTDATGRRPKTEIIALSSTP
jgi:hypothetical protein